MVATANSIEGLPPELVALGRWGEIFFYDLPKLRERAEIMAVHLRKRGRNPEQYNLAVIAAATEGFSGRELSVLVQNALLVAFKSSRPLASEDMVAVARTINPLSKQSAVKVATLRQWAADHNCRLANTPEDALPMVGTGGRDLEI